MTPRALLPAVLLFSLSALADDRAACAAGDDRACANLGRLKQQGALNSDGTRNTDALAASCGKALDAAAGAKDFGAVSRACAQLFNPKMAKSFLALAMLSDAAMIAPILATAYGEAYCPSVSSTLGCKGGKSLNFSNTTPAQNKAALRELNAKALEKELGAEKAAALTARFDPAWDRLLGK